MSESNPGGQPPPAAAGTSPGGPPFAAGPEPTVQWIAEPPPPGPAAGVEWAGYGERLVAYLLDGFLLSISLIVFVLVFGGLLVGAVGRAPDGTLSPAAVGLTLLFFLIVTGVSIAYFPFFWARGGQTPGMRPFGIRVVRDADGGRVTAGGAILRLLGMWVSAFVLYIGFIWIFIDKRRRGWHDLIGGTVVIKDAPRR